MPYKGDTWFRKKADPTFRQFVVKQVFADGHSGLVKLWQDEIISKLPHEEYWEMTTNETSTIMSNKSMKLSCFPPLGKKIGFEVAWYRDGWSCTISSLVNTKYDRPRLSETIFGDPNRTKVWSNNTNLFLKMVHELFARTEKAFKKQAKIIIK